MLPALLRSHSQPGPFSLSLTTLSGSEVRRPGTARPQQLKAQRGKTVPCYFISLPSSGRFLKLSVQREPAPAFPDVWTALASHSAHRRGSSSGSLICYLPVHAKVGGILTSGQCSSGAGTSPGICI